MHTHMRRRLPVLSAAALHGRGCGWSQRKQSRSTCWTLASSDLKQTHVLVPASDLCCSILQGAAAATAAADAQDDAGDEGTCSPRDSSSARDSSSSGYETLFFAGSLYHTYKGEIISLARGRPGSSASPGRYNPLVGQSCKGPGSALCWGVVQGTNLVCWAA